MAKLPQSDLRETLKNFKWTLIVTFAGVAISVLASYIETRTFDTVLVLMGLLISLMVAIVTSRYEEMVIMGDTVKELSQLYGRFEKLIYPMKVEQTSRLGVYVEAVKTLRNFVAQHKNSHNDCGTLLIIQRTPSPIFHSDMQKDKPGYEEEKSFSAAIFDAIELAKQRKIKLIFAFPTNDPKTLNAAKDLHKIDPEIVKRINDFGATFVNEKNPHENWDYLRLYPLNNRTVQPLMVADKLMEIYIEETKDEIVFIRTVNEEITTNYFEKYWKLAEAVSPVSARGQLDSIKRALSQSELDG